MNNDLKAKQVTHIKCTNFIYLLYSLDPQMVVTLINKYFRTMQGWKSDLEKLQKILGNSFDATSLVLKKKIGSL